MHSYKPSITGTPGFQMASPEMIHPHNPFKTSKQTVSARQPSGGSKSRNSEMLSNTISQASKGSKNTAQAFQQNSYDEAS
jgi:hypothetical protein